MENLITRYRNVSILVAVLFAQVLGLAVQVRRNTENDSSRLIRVWVVTAVTPMEKSVVWVQTGVSHLWHNYLYLRGVRGENRELKGEIERLRLEQVRLNEDAQQARRLQTLLSFKEQFISQTVAAQVIGSGGSEELRTLYIDKGGHAGIKPDMAVVTADGVVGKILRVYGSTSQVLLINDPSCGVGAILEKSRQHGIVKGTRSGDVILDKVMTDEQVAPGEAVVTSGGDLVFPKGLPLGTVLDVSRGTGSFLKVNIRSAAKLNKLEEVLVITKQENQEPMVVETNPVRAADILAQRLPSVPDKPVDDANKPGQSSKPGTALSKPQPGGVSSPKLNGNNPIPAGQGGNAAPKKKNTINPATGAAIPPALEGTSKPAGTGQKPQEKPESQPAPAEDKPQ